MLDYEITVPALAAMLSEKASAPFKLLDVREPWEHAVAHIEGSILMPSGEVPSRAPEELDAGEHIVVLCHAGVRSLNATVWLRNHGFERVQSVRGGIDAWSREVDPSVPRY